LERGPSREEQCQKHYKYNREQHREHQHEDEPEELKGEDQEEN
jgi:hypothetical protein